MAGQLKNLQTHVSKTLQDVMQALGGEDYAFYNFEIKGIAETERAKIQMAIKVLVPQSQRTTAAKKIKDALHRTRNTVVQDRAGTQLNVNIPNTPSGKVQYIRLDIKPIGTGRGSAATAVNECGQALYAEYAFNKIKGKIDITKPISKEDLKEVYDGKNVDVSFEDIMGLDGEWRESSILGANELWERFGKGKTYHFYRQDNNKLWSHKDGFMLPTNRDAKRKKIKNVRKSNRKYKPTKRETGIYYSKFCNYYCIPKSKRKKFFSAYKRKKKAKRKTKKRSKSNKKSKNKTKNKRR